MWFQTFQITLAILSFFLLGGLAVFYVMSKIRKQDMETLRDSNKDLREAIDDKGKEIANMRIEISNMRIEISQNQDQIIALKNSNHTLEQLVTTALDKYFVDNPQAALELAKLK